MVEPPLVVIEPLLGPLVFGLVAPKIWLLLGRELLQPYCRGEARRTAADDYHVIFHRLAFRHGLSSMNVRWHYRT